MTGRIDPMPQRLLAQALRYHIDQSQFQHTQYHVEAIAALIAENPTSSRSSHVRHNLGKARMEWLAERGLV